MKKMKVIMVKPFERAYVTELDGSLKGMQAIVGGLIQAIYPFEELVGLILAEEGKLEGMPPNRALYDENGTMYDIIVGNFFICGLSDDDFTDIQDENIDKFLNMYLYPETIVNIGGKVIAIKDKTNRDGRC